MTTFQKNSNVDYPCVKSRCYEDLRPKKKWKFNSIITMLYETFNSLRKAHGAGFCSYLHLLL